MTLVTPLTTILPDAWPHPADFPAPPSAADRARWADADRAARPDRLRRLRERMATEGVDGYFGVRWEHMRYLTGLPFDESEVTGSGDSGKFLVGLEDVWVLADSRYTIAVKREAPDSKVFECYNALTDRWADLVETVGVPPRAGRGMPDPTLTLGKPAGPAPERQAGANRGRVEADRQHKEPSELERVAAASAVADRALASLLPSIR